MYLLIFGILMVTSFSEPICGFCSVQWLQFPQFKYELHAKVLPFIIKPHPLLSYYIVKLLHFMHKRSGMFHVKSHTSAAYYASVHNNRSKRSVYSLLSYQAIHYFFFSCTVCQVSHVLHKMFNLCTAEQTTCLECGFN